MNMKDSDFQRRILATFKIEAEEHLRTFSAGLTSLSKKDNNPDNTATLEVLFREVHSLKGAARSVGYKEIESFCQPLEALFSALKRNEIQLSESLTELFYQSLEWLSTLMAKTGSELSLEMRKRQRELGQQLKDSLVIVAGSANKVSVSPEPLDLPASLPEAEDDTMNFILPTPKSLVRIPLSKLNPMMLQAEEMMQAEIALHQRSHELQSLYEAMNEWKEETRLWRGKKPSPASWNEWYDNINFHLNELENRLATITRDMEADHHSLSLMVNDQLDIVKQVLMLPVSTLVEVFPGMIREIAKNQQKEIEFITEGTELEIDKRILDELKDPLIHLIRNSIDHGIGTPAERSLQHKPKQGKITLSFTPKDNAQVEICLKDDGKGIDAEAVLEAALKNKTISSESAEKLNQQEKISLMFQSGVSTSKIITDISGRGLGMPIVQEKVENLGGKLFVETQRMKGTSIRIRVPMSMATFKGILVRLGEFNFILPIANVDRVLRISSDGIKTVENHRTIVIDQQVLSLVNLADVLGVSKAAVPKVNDHSAFSHLKVMVLSNGDAKLAFSVDEVLEEKQVLVKSLGKLLPRVRNIGGATVLGSGKVVPVLNVADLMKSALKLTITPMSMLEEEDKSLTMESILVAEDSITSRTLLKNILETAGYIVTTAVDGADAYAKVRKGGFDLVITDIDMPRMDGFELTTKIKNDKKLGETPVILVTSLDSREDKEKGIESGADAYIIKSSFDQGNLLEVIRKLI